jgi:hypothetical protein
MRRRRGRTWPGNRFFEQADSERRNGCAAGLGFAGELALNFWRDFPLSIL